MCVGLDVYAVTPHRVGPGMVEFELAPAEAFEGVPPLAAGLFSGGGPSFRGTSYARFIEQVAGVSLYAFDEDPAPPEVARRIAERLESAAAEGRLGYVDEGGFEHEVPPEEAWALAAWFRACAEGGYYVLVWY